MSEASVGRALFSAVYAKVHLEGGRGVEIEADLTVTAQWKALWTQNRGRTFRLPKSPGAGATVKRVENRNSGQKGYVPL